MTLQNRDSVREIGFVLRDTVRRRRQGRQGLYTVFQMSIVFVDFDTANCTLRIASLVFDPRRQLECGVLSFDTPV